MPWIHLNIPILPTWNWQIDGLCYNTAMTLNLQYAQIFTIVIYAIAVIMLISGFRKGVLKQFISFLSFFATLFLAWPLAGKLASDIALPFQEWLNSIWTGFSMPIAKQAVWFVILFIAIRIAVAFLSAFVDTLRKVKVISFTDRLGGLLLSAVEAMGLLILVCAMLLLPVFTNGKEFANAAALDWAVPIVEPYVSKIATVDHMIKSFGVATAPAVQKIQEITGLDEDSINRLMSVDLSKVPFSANPSEEDLQKISEASGVAMEKLESLKNLSADQIRDIMNAAGIDSNSIQIPAGY